MKNSMVLKSLFYWGIFVIPSLVLPELAKHNKTAASLAFVLVLETAVGGLVGHAIGERKGRSKAGAALGAALGVIGWLVIAVVPERQQPPAAEEGEAGWWRNLFGTEKAGARRELGVRGAGLKTPSWR